MARTIHLGELHRDDVQALLSLHVAAMRAHSPADACHVLPAQALDQPSITFFALRENGHLAGVGALKALGPDQGEIKSMRTASDFLGRRVGRSMLDAITAEARRRGYRRLLLETGTGPDFVGANTLYDRYGFRECGPFGEYPDSPFTRFMCYEL